MKNIVGSHVFVLKHLIKLGKAAEKELARIQKPSKRKWESLYVEFINSTNDVISETSAVDYRRWLKRLSKWAVINDIASPEKMSAEKAGMAFISLYNGMASAQRICRFYRRVWTVLGMDETIWTINSSFPSKKSEYYRRLTKAEIVTLLKNLKANAPDFYDMVVIAYYTGLRLSDIAELNLSELSNDKSFLFLIPNKVRTRRQRKLTIPLVREAQQIILRRAKEASTDGMLFNKASRCRPSRKICAAFRSCGIKKINSGRASFHSLRSTFISLMDEAGVLPYVTDAITGHFAGDMHARYSQPSIYVLKRAIMKAIPPLECRWNSDKASVPQKSDVETKTC